jgi:hypothetical protein
MCKVDTPVLTDGARRRGRISRARSSIETPLVANEYTGFMLGFDKQREFLPNIDVFDNLKAQRKLFYDFFNNQVDISLRFGQKEVRSWSATYLNDAFWMKIALLYGVVFIPMQYKKPNDTAYFAPFDTHIQKMLRLKKPKNIVPVCSIKQDFQNGRKLVMMVGGERLYFALNGQYAFEQFIMEQLGKIHYDREIIQERGFIDVIPAAQTKVRLLSYWQMFRPSHTSINEHIAEAVQCIKETSLRQIYIVYPKNREFKKHINVKVPGLESCGEYRIKIVPYSLRSILRKRRGRDVNCNILRK